MTGDWKPETGDIHKMKHVLKNIFFALIVALLFVACKDDNVTYAEELKAEQELIADFISRQQIQVVTVMPTTFPWPDKVYYKSKTGLCYRLTKQGDILQEGDSVIGGDVIVPRFDEYTLGVKADTISSQSSVNYPNPLQFNYLDLTQACAAWHEAVRYMKFNNAEAKLIVPSKIGMSKFSRPATPAGYDINIRISKY
jgi:hypothetical protein